MTKQYSAAERAGLAAWPRTSVTFERDAWVDFVGDLPPIADYAHLCQDA